MSNIKHLNPPDPLFSSDYEPSVPDGIYRFAYVRHSYVMAFSKSWKLFVQFRIIDEGKYFGVLVKRYYNVKKVNKKYRPPPTGNLNRDMRKLFGPDSIKGGTPFAKLRKSIVVAETETVKKDYLGKYLGKENEYSKITKLIRIEE